MIRFRVGIDPGLNGAVAVRDDDRGAWSIIEMPTCERGDQLIVDVRALDAFLVERCMPSETRIVVEDITGTVISKASRDYKYLASACKQMTDFGRILSALEYMEVPYDLATPKAWQASAEKKRPTDKAESIILAIDQYPEVQKLLLRDSGKTYHDGKAEAVLLVHHQYVQESKQSRKRDRK